MCICEPFNVLVKVLAYALLDAFYISLSMILYRSMSRTLANAMSLSLSKSRSCHLQSMSISDVPPGCQQKLVAVKLPLVADDGHVREVVTCERIPHIT